jgi:hypothetical protein
VSTPGRDVRSNAARGRIVIAALYASSVGAAETFVVLSRSS